MRFMYVHMTFCKDCLSIEPAKKDLVQRMSCIWSGNIEHILHAVQLRRIADQLLFWVLRIFKPWVTECLEHWFRETEDGKEEEVGMKTDQ